VRLIDRDVVELDNLQRQVLYEEADVEAALPKAVAAATRLGRINSEVEIEPHVLEVRSDNVRELVDGADLILDGTDNFATRYLLNEVSVSTSVPWIYGGVVASRGMVLPVVPGRTACFACLLPSAPDDSEEETCDTAGVIGPAVASVAALLAAEALKILVGRPERLLPGMVVLDLWENEHRVLRAGRRESCRVCGERIFDRLGAPARDLATRLCGGDAVRIAPAGAASLDLASLARTLESSGPVKRNDYLVRFGRDGLDLLVFADGRALVRGTEDPQAAREAYRRWVAPAPALGE